MAVEPETQIEAPTRTAREYPSLPSQGPPVEIFCRLICSLLHDNPATGVDILACQPSGLFTDHESHDVGQAGGLYYLVMEHVEGTNLREALTES